MDVYLIIAAFVFLLSVGLWAGRKVKDLRSFGLSKAYFSSFPLFATMVASFVGGGVIIGTAEKAFLSGIGYAVGLLGFSVQLMLTALFFAPRIARMNRVLSIGDIVKKYYGKHAQVLTGILWLSFCTGIIVAQMSALGKTLDLFLDWPYAWNVLLGAGVFILYSLLGGIRAVVITDVVQFVLLAVMIPLALILGVQVVGGVGSLWEGLPASYRVPLGHLHWLELAAIFFSFIVGDALIPPVVQRLLMARDSHQALRITFWGGWMTIPLILSGAGLGLVAWALNPNLDPGQIIPYLFKAVLPVWLQGLAILGVLSVIMSSADSYLNAAAVVFVNDVVNPLLKKPLSDKLSLGLARGATMSLGLFAIIFAVTSRNILDILLHTYKFWGPTVVVPLAFCILGKRLPIWSFYASCFAGVLVVLLWDMLRLESTLYLSGLLPGIMANLSICLLAYTCSPEKEV
ncbi:MAG: sodium:solute symporter [Opitutales bacterium]|tara:strand:+ start:710 stop:2083 length:1374 start_codon:yes stop_codon:yes gene_type:complete